MITPERGKTYIVKHSSGFIPARFISERPGSWGAHTHYIFQNLKTGRDIEVKSRLKIRREQVEK